MSDSGTNETLQAEHSTLALAVQHIDNTSTAIQGEMRNVENNVATLMAIWKGDASVQATQAMAHWGEAATKMNRVLMEIHDGIHGSNQTYQGAEEQNVSSIARAGNQVHWNV